MAAFQTKQNTAAVRPSDCLCEFKTAAGGTTTYRSHFLRAEWREVLHVVFQGNLKHE
jgi:hypothetical protein